MDEDRTDITYGAALRSASDRIDLATLSILASLLTELGLMDKGLISMQSCVEAIRRSGKTQAEMDERSMT